MMNGGVTLLLGLLSETRLHFWTARVLAAFAYTPIVRQLLWQVGYCLSCLLVRLLVVTSLLAAARDVAAHLPNPR